MTKNRLPDYLDHIQQAAADAFSFVEGFTKVDFLSDKRTQGVGDCARMVAHIAKTVTGCSSKR